MRSPRLLACLTLLSLVQALLMGDSAGAATEPAPPPPATLLEQARDAIEAYAWDDAQQILEGVRPRLSATRDSELTVRLDLLLGEVFEARGNLESALAVRGQALDAARLGNEVRPLAVALNETGRTAVALGHLERARRDLGEAAGLFKKTGDRHGSVHAHMNLGNLYFRAGRYPMARRFYEQASDLLRQAPADTETRTLQASLVVNQANVAWREGDPARARQGYDRARALVGTLQDPSLRGRLLLNLGSVLMEQGGYDDSLAMFNQAGEAFRQANLTWGDLQTSLRMAQLYLRLGGYEQALALMNDVDRGRAGEPSRVPAESRAPLAMNKAIAWRMLGDPEQARLELDLLRKDRTLRLPTPALAAIQLQLGTLACQAGDYPAAHDHYRLARTLLAASADLTSLGWLGVGSGELKLNQGSLEEAEVDFLGVLQTARTPSNPMPDLAWRACFGLGRLARARGDRAGALERYLEAVRLLEQIRGNLSTEELKTTFASDKHPVFEELIDLLLEMDRPREAFEVSERARACALLDILRRGQVALEAGEVPPSKLAEIQAGLPADVTLLSYFVAREKTWLWIVSARSMTVRVLPVRRAWLADILGDGKYAGLLRLPVEADLGAVALEILPHRELGQLYEALVAPAEADLPPGTRVGVLPDGPLYYLPFSLLVTGPRQGLSPEVQAAIRQQGTGRWLESDYLVERHPLFYAQSASLLVRPGAASRVNEPPELNGSLVYAAPLTAGARTEARGPRSLLRVAHDQFAELPGARAEGRAIEALDSRNLLRAGPDCRESTFFEDVARSRFTTIHLATHGFVDDRNPLLSGLVMCPEPPPYNGFVLARDVYQSHIQADLVVMSACRSGLGSLAGGEGIIGLTRAFQVSGVPRVMATLWSISDQDTGPLMVAFHQGLASNRGSVAQALRNAQMEVLKRALAHPTEVNLRRAHPYMWAPFVPTGADW